MRTFGRESVERNARLAVGEYAPLLTDDRSRLLAMDAAGVDVQAVSVIPTQYHYWADRGLAGEIVSAVNEHVAAMARRHPSRLVGLATVSLQHPDLAAGQLADAAGRLALRGVEISTSAASRDLSDPYFEPFFATAAQLGAFVFIHPWGCSLGERLDSWYLGNVIGQPTETTLALSHLIFGGVLDRHPDLVVCGAHGGGYLPQYIGRADHAYAVRPESAAMKQPPSAYLRTLYFDSLVYTPGTARHLIDAAGPGHVLLGTDFPFDMGVTDPVLEQVIRPLGAATIVPGHGPVCGPEVIEDVLGYLRFIQDLARGGKAARLSPLAVARQADLGAYAALTDSERVVGNLHRAYLELEGGGRGAPIDAAGALRDMVAYNGGRPLTCHA